MMSKNLNILLLALLFVFSISSCEKETSDSQAESYAEDTATSYAIETRSGSGGCYEIVFPIGIQYPDSDLVEYNSMEDLKAGLKEWRLENNPSKGFRPVLAYPVDLISQDGEVISVETRKELREIIRECRKEYGKARPCFKMVYPISINFPDDSVVEYVDRKDLKNALRTWKKENPSTTERPLLDYPVEIIYKNGETATINSKEELIQAKQECD